MIRSLAAAALLALSLPPAAAVAQEAPRPPIAGTRLDISATGEVSRVPDIARIGAGVVTQAKAASEAIAQNARQMNRVIAALKSAGIADRDIQTSSISLNPEYRYVENQSPVLTGYRASNEVNIRFRDIAKTGLIIDALVAQGANQINGPTLGFDKPEQALDEARLLALANARARADLFARALGKTVKRILWISEAGAAIPYPAPPMERSVAAQTKVAPGEQTLSATVSMSFELD